MSDALTSVVSPEHESLAVHTYALPDPLQPKPGESLVSLILRNAQEYQFRNPLRLLKRIGRPGNHLPSLAFTDPSTEFGRQLARLLGVTPTRLACMSYGTEDTKVCSLLGHKVHHDFVTMDDRGYCPRCLVDSPHHRAIWDLSVITVCPVHEVRLVRKCPRGHAVNWHTDRLHLCGRVGCRADFRESEVEQVSPDELAGVRGIAAMLNGNGSVGLAPMQPGDAIRACFHLGSIARGQHSSLRPLAFARQHPEETARIINDGWPALVDWPRGFQALLAQLRAGAAGRSGRYGLAKQFGRLPKFLADMADEPFGILLATEFNRYVAEQDDLATRAHEVRRVRSSDDLRHRHMSATEASDLLGISYERLTVLAERNDLYLVAPTGKGAACLMRADRVHALHQQRSGLLTREDVRRLLGIGKATADKLRSAGLLPAVADPDDATGVRYPVSGVERLLNDVAARLSGDTGMPTGVTIATIARRVPRPGYDSCDVIEAVLAGALSPAGVNAKARGLQRFLFKPTDVDRFVAAVMHVEGRTLSVQEAGQELGIKKEVAYHCVRSGWLATTTVNSAGEVGLRLTQAAVDAFRSEYVTGSEFARVHQLGRKWAGTHLVAAGVQAVCGPSVDGCRQFLFRRADLKGFDAERLVSGQSKLRPKTAQSRAAERLVRNTIDGALDRALQREFGGGLVRRYKEYCDIQTATVVQALIAKNQGTVGTYEFRLSAKHRAELAKATRGFLAISFEDRNDYLLVPWPEVKPMVASMPFYEAPHGRVTCLWLRADASGRLTPFGHHTRQL